MGFFSDLRNVVNAINDMTDGEFNDIAEATKKKLRQAENISNKASIVLGKAYEETSKEVKKGLKQAERDINRGRDFGDATERLINTAAKTIVNVSNVVVKTTKKLVDLVFIKEEAKLRCPNAVRAIIMEKKKNAVDVGIFKNDKIAMTMTINSDIGISNNIYQGQVITL